MIFCFPRTCVLFSSQTDVAFSTEIQPVPEYDGLAVIILHEEEKTTVSFTCVAFQDDQLRNALWLVQWPEDTEKISIQLNSMQFVRSGVTNRNFTIVNVPKTWIEHEFSLDLVKV